MSGPPKPTPPALRGEPDRDALILRLGIARARLPNRMKGYYVLDEAIAEVQRGARYTVHALHGQAWGEVIVEIGSDSVRRTTNCLRVRLVEP